MLSWLISTDKAPDHRERMPFQNQDSNDGQEASPDLRAHNLSFRRNTSSAANRFVGSIRRRL